MTRKEAKETIEKLRKKYGKNLKKELANRTGCNPDNYDVYGLLYCTQFNTMSRKYAAERARAKKGHGIELFKEGRLAGTHLRRIVEGVTRRVLNETRFGEPKHIEGDIVNGKSGYLVADNGNGGDVAILDDLQFLGNSIVGINRDTDEEETLYLTGMFARPLDGFTLPSASKTRHGVVVKHLRWDDDDDFYQLEVHDFLSSPESAAESDYEDYANENNI